MPSVQGLYLDLASPRDADRAEGSVFRVNSSSSLAQSGEVWASDELRSNQSSSSLPPRPSTAGDPRGPMRGMAWSPRRAHTLKLDSPRSPHASPGRGMRAAAPWSPAQGSHKDSLSTCASPCMSSPRTSLPSHSNSPSPRRRMRLDAFIDPPTSSLDPSSAAPRGIVPFPGSSSSSSAPAPVPPPTCSLDVPPQRSGSAPPHSRSSNGAPIQETIDEADGGGPSGAAAAASKPAWTDACSSSAGVSRVAEEAECCAAALGSPGDGRKGLLDLPEDAVAGVLSHLDAESLASVMCTCTTLLAAGSDELLWEPLFLARWRHRGPAWALLVAAPENAPGASPADATAADRVLEGPPESWRCAFLDRLGDQPAVPLLPDTVHTRRTLEVGLPGGSGLRSVREACLLAGQGDTILVHPGTYEGTVALPAGVELRGVGRREDVMLVTDDAPALIFRSPKGGPPGLVTNLTLWRQASAAPPPGPGQPAVTSTGCVSVEKGALRLDSCNVVSAGEGVVGEQGAALSVTCCDVTTMSSGFVASAGEIGSCHVAGAGEETQGSVFAAITILSGSVNVVNNRIVRSTAHGLAVLDSGCGLVQHNLISQNVGAGVCVGLAGDPHLDHNVISENGGQGIAVYSDGLGSFVRCDVSGNALHGIDVISTRVISSPPDEDAVSHPLFESCTVHGNDKGGVAVHDNATASMRGCQLHSNRGPNADVYAGGYLALEGSTVTDGCSVGVRVRDPSSRATVINCAISSNAEANVEVSNWAEPLLVGCEVERAGGSGVVFSGGGQGTLQSCRVARNGRCGVELGGWGAPVLERCAVARNCEDGIVFHDGARGSVRRTRCYGNSMAGIWAKPNAVPSVEGCDVDGNGMEGLRLGQGRAGCIMLGAPAPGPAAGRGSGGARGGGGGGDSEEEGPASPPASPAPPASPGGQGEREGSDDDEDGEEEVVSE